MAIFLFISAAILVVFVGVGIKLLVKKDGEFAGSCASKNPMLADESGVCGTCGRPAGTTCEED